MKPCRQCGWDFAPKNSLQVICSPRCAIRYEKAAAKQKKKKERERRALMKEDLKTRSEHLKDAQTYFNRWIRFRDRGKPCISCGKYPAPSVKFDAGHYLTTGAHPELRFNEDNCHKQCVQCNNHLSGNLVRYRQGLIRRIGENRVSILEGPHLPLKLNVEQILNIKRKYMRRLSAAKKKGAVK